MGIPRKHARSNNPFKKKLPGIPSSFAVRRTDMTKEETNREFQVSRRMFAIKGDEWFDGGVGNSDSHLSWFVNAGIIKNYDDPDYEFIVRGFYLREQLHVYRGRNFSGGRVCREALIPHLEAMQKAFDMPESTQIYIGATPGDNLAQWHGHINLGTISQFLEHAAW